MKSTRERILSTLLAKRQATINDLSEAVGINGISVRHHLINLQAEGLITSEEQRHGVGRPRFVYCLTDKGLERFPSNYLRLTEQLLEKLEKMLPKENLNEIYTQIGLDMAENSCNINRTLPVEEQLEQLSEQLANSGYYLSWQNTGQHIVLFSYNCPYRNVGASHAGICKIDHVMFTSALGRDVTPDKCVLLGDPRCTYIINP